MTVFDIKIIERKWLLLCREKRDDWGGQHIMGWSVAKLLGDKGGVNSVDVLIHGLNHKDERYRWYSATAIQKLSKGALNIEDLVVGGNPEDTSKAISKTQKWIAGGRKISK